MAFNCEMKLTYLWFRLVLKKIVFLRDSTGNWPFYLACMEVVKPPATKNGRQFKHTLLLLIFSNLLGISFGKIRFSFGRRNPLIESKTFVVLQKNLGHSNTSFTQDCLCSMYDQAPRINWVSNARKLTVFSQIV